MTRRSAIKRILLGLAVLLVAGFILLFTMDLGFLRGMVEDQVRQATGREFAIRGPVSIRLGRELQFEAEDIELRNPEWAGGGPMAHVAALQARIDTRSLLAGPLRVRDLELSGLDLALVQDAEGRANWELAGADSEGGSGAPAVLSRFRISDSNISLQSPRLDQPLNLRLEQLQQTLGEDGYLENSLQAELNGRAVRFEGRAGPYSQLINGERVGISGQGRFGQTDISGTATLDNLLAPERPEFELNIKGPELAELTSMLGIEGLGNGALDLTARATPGNEQLKVTVNGRLGPLQLDVEADAPSLSDTRNARLRARLGGPNFGRLARLAGFEGWPESPFTLDASVYRPGSGLHIDQIDISLANARLELSGEMPGFPALAGATLELLAEGKEIAPFESALGMTDMPRGAFRISGQVSADDDDSAELSLDYRFPIAQGDISGRLGGGADLLGTALKINAQGPDAMALGNNFDLPGLPKAPWTMALQVAIEEAGAYRLDAFSFNTRGFNGALSGKLDADRPNEIFALRFDVKGDRLADFQAMAGESADLPKVPFKATGGLTGKPGQWRLDQVSGSAGHTALTVDGQLGLGDDMDGTELRVKANGPDTDGLPGLPAPFQAPRGPFELDTKLKLAGGTLDIGGLTLDAGPLSLKMNASLAWPLGAAGGNFDLDARGQDIRRILPAVGGFALAPNSFEAVFKGNWNDRGLRFDTGSARIGDARLGAKGTLALPPGLAGTDLRLDVTVPDLAKLGATEGAAGPKLPLQLQASFSGTETLLRADPLRAQLGGNTLSGRLEVNFQPKVPGFELALNSDALDLRPLQPDPAASAKEPVAPDARVIPELPYPLETLAAANGRFEIKAGRLTLRQGTFRNGLLTGAIRDGALIVSELGMDGYQGRLEMNLDLQPAGEAAKLTANISATDFVLDRDGLSAEQKAASAPITANMQLVGRGAGLRETAASLTGGITLGSTGGKLYRSRKDGAREQLTAAVLAAINPALARQDVMTLACVSGDMKATGGRLALEPGLIVYTDKLKIFAGGSINLANENLDLSVRTQERTTGDESAKEQFAPALRVSGTLANHSIGLDRKATLLSGGASFLKGGLSDLAKLALDQGQSGATDACAEMIRQREQQTPP